MKKLLKNKDGITLISLVVTIIILLILAGITIGMLSGDNGILGQAGNAKTQTDISEEKEILQTSALSAMGKSKYGDIAKDKLDAELNKYSGIDSTQETDEGIEVTFSSGRTYLVDADGNVELSIAKPKIVSSKIVNSSGNEVSEPEEAEQLYIIITPSIDGGTIESLICNEGNTVEKQNDGTYKVTISKNGTYTFKIVGKIDGKESTSNSVPVTADSFKIKTAENTLIIDESSNIKSPYVKYVDKNGNEIMCRVLWDINSKYALNGIQIIAENPVTKVKLGKSDTEAQKHGNSDYEKAKWSYNNVLNTLNNKAINEYLNTMLSPDNGARCVGSIPDNPYKDDSGNFIFPENYSETAKEYEIKDKYDQHQIDQSQLAKLDILKSNQSYWIPSRDIYSTSSSTKFEILFKTASGTGDYKNICDVNSDGSTTTYTSSSIGFRPVFTIKPEIKITGGDGKTAETAYTLGL